MTNQTATQTTVIENFIAAHDAAHIIDAHMTAWNGTTGAHLDACTGFGVWAQDVLEETRAALVDGDIEQIAADVVYSLAQAHHEVTEYQATEWLQENREGLIAAM